MMMFEFHYAGEVKIVFIVTEFYIDLVFEKLGIVYLEIFITKKQLLELNKKELLKSLSVLPIIIESLIL